ncbi:MAG TPA: hypothetical protein VG900_09190 [Hyphomicrobiaceae bacterium]|jgi:hypothetical protein|nr:hypothetical protein [Hyphomicrobiaceae bacterium]
MRLSDDKAKRLSALVWRERVKFWLPLVVGAIAIFGMLTFLVARQIGKVDQTVAVETHNGTVVTVTRNARSAAIVHVLLDDGRDVDAFSAMRLVPVHGAHVIVNQARHASGRLTFDVTGLAP